MQFPSNNVWEETHIENTITKINKHQNICHRGPIPDRRTQPALYKQHAVQNVIQQKI